VSVRSRFRLASTVRVMVRFDAPLGLPQPN